MSRLSTNYVTSNNLRGQKNSNIPLCQTHTKIWHKHNRGCLFKRRKCRVALPSLNSTVSSIIWKCRDMGGEWSYMHYHTPPRCKEGDKRATNLLAPPTRSSTHDQRTLFLSPVFPSHHLNKSEKTGWDCAIPIIFCNKLIATLTFPLQLYRNSFLLFPANAVSPELKLCFCLEHFSATDMQL